MNFLKKNVSFLMISLMALTLTTVSCSKDDDKDDDAKPSLVGTVWKQTGSYWVETITFAATTYSDTYIEDDWKEPEGVSGTYTYKDPSIIMINSNDGYTRTGTINGNVMTLVNDGYSETFIKQ